MHLADPGRLVGGSFLRRTVVQWRLVCRDFLEKFVVLLKFALLSKVVVAAPVLALAQSAVVPFQGVVKNSKKVETIPKKSKTLELCETNIDNPYLC